MLCDPETHANCKNQCQAHQPEKLEVDPCVRRTGVGHDEVDDADGREKGNPSLLKCVPGRIRHFDFGVG